MARFLSYCEALFVPGRLDETYLEGLLQRIKGDSDLETWERIALNEYIAAYARGSREGTPGPLAQDAA